jgi:hypothetical protein
MVILPVILYGCETWSLTLGEDHRLRVCENRLLRRLFGPQRDEVTGEWRRLNNEELNDLYYTKYYLGDQIKKKEMGGACSTYGERRGAFIVLVGKPEGKRPIGRPRC